MLSAMHEDDGLIWLRREEAGALLRVTSAAPQAEGLGMNIRSFSASSAPAGGHAQVCEVSGATRLAFVSGQVPATAKGDVPETFDEQSRLIWTNIEAQLAEVGMTLDNVVKVTTFLS